VQEVTAQAAAHHPVRGHRRVDPAGHQDQRPAAHADRQTALAGHAIRVYEDLLLVHFHEDRRIRVLEADRVAVGLLHAAADRRRKLGRGHPETLVATVGTHRERAVLPGDQVERGRGGRLGVSGHPDGAAHPGDAHDILDAFGDLVGRGLGGRAAGGGAA